MFNLYTDGGSRGNPGDAAYGCALFDSKMKLVAFDAKFLGTKTNNQAEYEGIIAGLKLSAKNGVKDLACYLDSELIVKQINGIYKVKDEKMKTLFKSSQKQIKKFDNIEFAHVVREKNKVADKLVNIAIDSARA